MIYLSLVTELCSIYKNGFIILVTIVFHSFKNQSPAVVCTCQFFGIIYMINYAFFEFFFSNYPKICSIFWFVFAFMFKISSILVALIKFERPFNFLFFLLYYSSSSLQKFSAFSSCMYLIICLSITDHNIFHHIFHHLLVATNNYITEVLKCLSIKFF